MKGNIGMGGEGRTLDSPMGGEGRTLGSPIFK